MIVSSDKANLKAAEAVDFAAHHRWAKYFCLSAVAVIYSTDYVAQKLRETAEKIRQSISAPFRPLGKRLISGVMAAAFAVMILPAAEAGAEQGQLVQPIPAQNETVDLPQPNSVQAKRPIISVKPEEIAKRITMAGLAENNKDYAIKLNIRTLKKDLTARFTYYPSLDSTVRNAFDYYGISTADLQIAPVDIDLYTTEDRYKLQISDGYSADITLPIPDNMRAHFGDLKVIRLEDDGTLTIIEGDIVESESTITFNTSHFSIFALVAYSDNVVVENISSGAGMTASGTVDTAVNLGLNVFDEDKRRYKKIVKKKIYRIKRIVKENELLL